MDLTRLVAGVGAALLLPYFFATLRSMHLVGVIYLTTFAAYAVFPVLDGWGAWVLWSATCATGLCGQILDLRQSSTTISASLMRLVALIPLRGSQSPASAEARPRRDQTWHLSIRVSTVLVLLLAAAMQLQDRGWDALVALILDDSIAVVLCGALYAVFIGNGVVVAIVRPFMRRLEFELTEASSDDKGKHDASPLISEYIGRLERALIYILVASGQPEAAAIVIAVKSLARLPEVQRRSTAFFEFFLIGTLASVIVAVVVAIAVRLALGLPPA